MSAEQCSQEQLEALRASARCGRRSVPALHLLEADEELTQVWWRLQPTRVALCGVELSESTPVPDFEDCPGCADCTRYCTRCVRVAARWSEVSVTETQVDDDEPTGWAYVGDCPHPVAGGPAFHIGPCLECAAAEPEHGSTAEHQRGDDALVATETA